VKRGMNQRKEQLPLSVFDNAGNAENGIPG
jgi:hypothetical protein